MRILKRGRRKTTAGFLTIAMMAATCAIVSSISPASSGVTPPGTTGVYDFNCDLAIDAGTGPIVVADTPTPIGVTTFAIQGDPADPGSDGVDNALPNGEAVTSAGIFNVTVLGALGAGVIAATGEGSGQGTFTNMNFNVGARNGIGSNNVDMSASSTGVLGTFFDIPGRQLAGTTVAGSNVVEYRGVDAVGGFVSGAGYPGDTRTPFSAADLGASFATSALSGGAGAVFPATAIIGGVTGSVAGGDLALEIFVPDPVANPTPPFLVPAPAAVSVGSPGAVNDPATDPADETLPLFVGIGADLQVGIAANGLIDPAGAGNTVIGGAPAAPFDFGTHTTAGFNTGTMDIVLDGGGQFDVFFNFGLPTTLTTNGGKTCEILDASVSQLAAAGIPGFDAPAGSIDLVAPIQPPECVDGFGSVGLTQSVDIDLAALCIDQNDDPDPALIPGELDISTLAVSTPPSNGTVTIDPATGIATYLSQTDPGGVDTFGFTVDDVPGTIDPTTGLETATSVEAIVNVTVLANLCDATGAGLDGVFGTADDDPPPVDCSLTQIVTFEVVGAQRTLEQVDKDVVLTDPDGRDDFLGDDPATLEEDESADDGQIILSGQPQVVQGSLQNLEVLNARGDGAGWAVTAYATDFGTAGTPLADFDGAGGPQPPAPACSPDAEALGTALNPLTGVGTVWPADRNCIPGSNMGWGPTANVVHDRIPGDVADVTAGAASATDALDWLSQLIAEGNAATDAFFGDGSNIGGLTGYDANLGATQNTLCSSPDNQSGGTFFCDADLWLGIPATAGSGIYQGAIILTLT